MSDQLGEVLVSVEGVSKKFCRSLKRSLWYGVQDVTSELLARRGGHDELRQSEFWAVDDVSFELRRGECLGLIGPNGAGKSTLLKMLNGLVKPDKGSITMRGRVGALIELGAGFNPILTARENIYVNGAVLGFTKKEIDRKFEAIVDFAEIEEFIDTPVQSFSSGMKVRLGFAVASQIEPDVLLIDEVLAVGDVQFRLKCFERIIQLREDGASILLVTHSLTDINRICDQIVVLAQGTVVCDADVPTGITAYLRVCSKRVTNSTSSYPAEIAELVGLEINQGDGSTLPTLASGEALELNLLIECRIPKSSVRIWVGINSPLYGLVSSFSSIEDGYDIQLVSGVNKVRLLIPNLPLRIGHYAVSCGIYDMSRFVVHDFKETASSFEVVGPRPQSFGFGSGGIIQISHSWGY